LVFYPCENSKAVERVSEMTFFCAYNSRLNCFRSPEAVTLREATFEPSQTPGALFFYGGVTMRENQKRNQVFSLQEIETIRRIERKRVYKSLAVSCIPTVMVLAEVMI